MVDKSKFISIKKDLEEQRFRISEEELLFLKDWHNYLNNFFGDNGGYVVYGDKYIKYNNIISGIVPMNGISNTNNYPLNWYRLNGIVVNINAKNINDCFSQCCEIKIDETPIRICTKKEFEDNLKIVCKKLFFDSEENVEFQYQNYTSNFYRYILLKNKDLFPDYVFNFVNKLEKLLDADLYYENV